MVESVAQAPGVRLVVRPLSKGELEELAAAISDGATLAQVENRWAEQEMGYRSLFVAEEDGKLLGTVSVFPLEQPNASLHLFALDVAPWARNHGVGRALVEHVIEEARRRGHKRVHLEVRTDNPARRLYHRLGFRRVGPAFVNSWWRFEDDGGRTNVQELSYRMAKRVR